MSNIVKREQLGVVPQNMADLERLGSACVASGFFADAKDAGQAMIKIQAGAELGIPPVQAMTNINVIKGRITLSAGLMAALLRRAGYKIRVTWTQDPLCCNVSVWQGAEHIGDSPFSTQDARQAGLGGANWQKYPRNMLYARAVSNAARWYAPEVLTGCYLPDELEDAPEDLRPAQPIPTPSAIGPAGDKLPTPARSHQQQPTPQPTIEPAHHDAVEAEIVESTASAAPPDDEKRERFMRKLHAIGKDLGLSHEELRQLIGLDSLKDATGDLLEWSCSLLSCEDVERLRSVWNRMPMAHRKQLAALKDWGRAHLPQGGEG